MQTVLPKPMEIPDHSTFLGKGGLKALFKFLNVPESGSLWRYGHVTFLRTDLPLLFLLLMHDPINPRPGFFITQPNESCNTGA